MKPVDRALGLLFDKAGSYDLALSIARTIDPIAVRVCEANCSRLYRTTRVRGWNDDESLDLPNFYLWQDVLTTSKREWLRRRLIGVSFENIDVSFEVSKLTTDKLEKYTAEWRSGELRIYREQT